MSWKGGIIWNQVSLFDTIDGLLKSMGFLLTISMRFLANSSSLGHMNIFPQNIKVIIPIGPIRGNENGVSQPLFFWYKGHILVGQLKDQAMIGQWHLKMKIWNWGLPGGRWMFP